MNDSLARAWAGGWQPADLLRYIRRELGPAYLPLACSVIAGQLATYAAATVDPRWAGQLREFESGPVVIPGRPALLPAFIGVLPAIDVIGPRPGEYRARAGDRPDVDAKVLALIRGLLAKAEATTSEAEAEAFMAGAQERMARYSIDVAMLTAKDPGARDRPAARRLGVDQPYESAKVALLGSVALANRCRTVWSRPYGFCTVIGFEAELAAVEALFTSLLVQAVAAMNRAGRVAAPGGRARTRGFRRSFLVAYADRIGERLAAVARAQTEVARAELSAGSGSDLLPVLAARGREVDERVGELFPNLRTTRLSRVTDAAGWASGRGAADLADLGAGQPLRS